MKTRKPQSRFEPLFRPRIALPKWPKSAKYEPAPKQFIRKRQNVVRGNQPSFDQSNRYVTATTRITGTRQTNRSKYGPKIGSKVKIHRN